MSENDAELAILLADVVGSTSLYESHGNDRALGLVTDCIDRICRLITEAGGEFVHSKGDDILAAFVDPAAALSVVFAIFAPGADTVLPIRVGLHFGSIIRARADIFGDAVNLTARLASTANPGEALISQDLVDRLPRSMRSQLRYLDAMALKGKSQPCRIYTLPTPDHSLHTDISSILLPRKTRIETSPRAVEMTLVYRDRTWQFGEGATVTLGRLPDCDLLIDRPWVSRLHASITIADGRVRLAERSSSGTFIMMGHSREAFIRREDVLLLGSGTISPSLRPAAEGAEVVRYAIS
ncbi:adenylate/guanylate cyclase domain-containing protein [Bosea sp. PAMC 26642]|uniref:adenylate/guanylate cyclase domain-containing protein n=1 Tax=Bosea sp. (strain PAMC 26642) TaxID=1792307 RepID=UPI00076FF359|nr:adenylate/guanylate cyclase domain-containing protein [Bosea sp. PAMC 26642]AMJ62575.1 hypothetical protein AXW83_21775 [Bosea sp. PAMC 26642]